MTSPSPLNDPSVPDPGGACFYLDLPRELRDMINVFALEYRHGLICAPSDGCWAGNRSLWDPKLEPFESDDRPPKREIDGFTALGDPNPLRLVCHQTRAETCGLLLKLNNLRFQYRCEHCTILVHRDCQWFESSRWLLRDVDLDQFEFGNRIDMTEVFRSFYRQCSATNKNRLLQVTIEQACYAIVQAPEAHNILACYVRDYAHHENISFNIVLQLVHDDESLFVCDCLGTTQAFKLVFKGPKTSRFGAASLWQGDMACWRMRLKLQQMRGSTTVPHNVQFSIGEESPEQLVKDD